MPDFNRILAAKTPLTLASLARGAQPLVLADLARAAKTSVTFIAPDDAAMRAVSEAANYFAPELEVIEFPAWDCLPYDRASPALSVSAKRLAALHRLQNAPKAPQLLVTTINALLQRVVTRFRIRESVRLLKPGMEIGRESLIQLLQRQGYSRTDTVADAGEFAVRGSIFDIFPSGLEQGLRLDFFGDELETLRLFDPNTQRSTGSVAEHLLLPASEALLDEDSVKRFRTRYREQFGADATSDPLYQAVSDGRRLAGMEHWLPLFEERLETLFDHLGARRSDADRQQRARSRGGAPGRHCRLLRRAHRYLRQGCRAAIARSIPPRSISLARNWTSASPDGRSTAPICSPSPRASASSISHSPAPAISPPSARGETMSTRRRRSICTPSPSRAARRSSPPIPRAAARGLSRSWGKPRSPPLPSRKAGRRRLASPPRAVPAALVLPLETGFSNAEVELVTEQDILGDRLVRRKKKRKDADAFLAELSALTPGDLVVHMGHGVGRYEGLQSIPVGKSPHDCVALTYAGGDKLYIPVENLDVLSRFGSENEGVALDRLGGEAWQRRKARLKERIREIAHELLRTAAARALRQAPVLLPEQASYDQFAERFPWEETDDQERAIEQVLADLGEGKPMDRLVCGDVGFGKTEVALRAAFVAAMGGQQVALVAPTTLLARQHYKGFVERFAGFPLNIGRLSRLVPEKEASATKAGLADGTMDVVIGTHAILSKSLSFKRLGLVVVDEEQHFGVTHKEKLKQLRADVHVLTLTATPIPRTLQMAMSGLRELSTIQTPPVDRLAVRTYVMEWDDMVMREALLREHHRGGQSFVVVPRIADMPDLEEWLRQTVPEIKAVSAHGQMGAGEVEERMSAFYEGKYDVLLSTTIVESGLDIPAANTIIIHRADRFGLAQLYQLRGRVGRSKLRAYAYLTTPADTASVRNRSKAAQGARRPGQPGRGVPARQPRSRHPRRGKPARRRAVAATSARSASNSTSRCWRTRSWPPRPARSAWPANAPRSTRRSPSMRRS